MQDLLCGAWALNMEEYELKTSEIDYVISEVQIEVKMYCDSRIRRLP